ncbi:hypothetical protein PMAYCL1PPCAC_13702, partial [Pristionchus mayeri]
KGVGQWCVNVMGSSLCCDANSKERECQGIHVFKHLDKEVIAYDNTNSDAKAKAEAAAQANANATVSLELAPDARKAYRQYQEGSKDLLEERGGSANEGSGGFITIT